MLCRDIFIKGKSLKTLNESIAMSDLTAGFLAVSLSRSCRTMMVNDKGEAEGTFSMNHHFRLRVVFYLGMLQFREDETKLGNRA